MSIASWLVPSSVTIDQDHLTFNETQHQPRIFEVNTFISGLVPLLSTFLAIP